MAEELGTAYIRLLPSMRGFARAATKQLSRSMAAPARKAGEDAGDEFGDGVDRSLTGRSSRLGRGFAKGFSTGIGKGLRLSLKPVAAAGAGVFAAQFLGAAAAGLASGVPKLAQGLGAGLALLPAAAGAAALALGTLKIALSGVGDAISAGLTGDTEAFNEALGKLSPSARDVARDIVSMKGRLDQLKATVQERFFEPLTESIRPLGFFLRQAEIVMGDVARTAGQVTNGVAGWLAIPGVARSIFDSMVNMGTALRNVLRAAGHLPQAFLPLVTVGSTFLPGLTSGLDDAASRFAIFMQRAERTGQLRSFIQGGIDGIRSLIDTGKQVGRIFANIGDIFATVFGSLSVSSGGLLDSFENLTEKVGRFVSSARGSAVLGQVFESVGAVAGALRATFGRLATIAVEVFQPVLPQVTKLAEAVINLADGVLGSLEPALRVASDLLGSVILPALTGVLNVMSGNRVVLGALAGVVVAFFVAWAVSAAAAALATLAAAAPLILLGLAIGALAALVIIHFDTIKSAIAAAFNWVKNNWPLLLGILFGPFGLAAVLIIKHRDKIWNAIKAVFRWVRNNWPKILFFLVAPFAAAAVLIGSKFQVVRNAATGAKNWVVGRFNALVGFVRGLPSRISSASSRMWDGIKTAFKSVINTIIGWWNGLQFTMPTFDIPSVDLGPLGSIGGGSFGGWTVGTPDIPTLHRGGQFRAPPGQNEGLALLKDYETVLPPGAGGSVGPGSAPAPAEVEMRVMGGANEFTTLIQKLVRVGKIQLYAGGQRVTVNH